MTANAASLAADLPHIEKDVRELADLSEELATLQTEQAHYRGKAREATAKIRRLAARGDRIRGRVGASLRGRYGFDSARLIQAGFKPHPSKRRLDDEDEPAPSPAERLPAKSKPRKRSRAKAK